MRYRSLNWRLQLLAAVVIAVVLGPIGAADGQYQLPQQGNAIDASNQVGAYGLNRRVPQPTFNSANLYVTGNVTAGRQFRGFSPIQDPSSLFTSIPSSRLSGFEADAIGLQDVLAGRSNYQVSPYFAPTRTVANVGAIQRRLNQPGSSILRNPTINVQREFDSTLPRDVLLESTLTDLSLNAARIGTEPAGIDVSAYGYLSIDPDARRRLLARSPLFQSSVFRNIANERAAWAPETRMPVRTDLPTRLVDEDGLTQDPLGGPLSRQTDFRAEAGLVSPRQLAPGVFGERSQREGERLAGVGPRPMAPSPAAPAPMPSTLEPPTAPEPRITPGALVEEPAPSDTTLTLYAPAGESPYDDFVRAVDWLRRVQGEELETVDPSALEAAEGEARRLLERPPASFAGETDSAVNRLIVDAEAAVRKGEFYKAAAMYRSAAALDRDNALIHLGHGHALLFAGDYMGAVYHLTRGIRQFEDIAYFPIDLPRFLPDPTLLDIRRADLEDRLAREEDYRLRFLLGYAEYYSGLPKYGLPNLRKAATEAREAIESGAVSAEQTPVAEVIAGFPARLQSDSLLPGAELERPDPEPAGP